MTALFDWSRADGDARAEWLARPRRRENKAMLARVREIVDEVRAGGWDALVAIAREIDGQEPVRLAVAPFAERARERLSAEARAAIDLAFDNVTRFHEASLPKDVTVEPAPGVEVTKRWVALDSAGLYVPGGKAPLFSTLLMLAIPARVAGVSRLEVVTPPRLDGGLDLAVAYAADKCGIEAIWTVGGAQAIAALSFGAGDIAPVDRICGPGNAWVAAAKSLVSSLPGGPGIDLPAGPSELMVIASDGADPATVAADLLSQAEHDLDAQALLVATDEPLGRRVLDEVASQSAAMGGGFAPVRGAVAPLDQAIAIANAYAPEHLSLALPDREAEAAARGVRNAGTVFVGRAAAETFGDYLAGPSHVLPTDRAARFTGGVTTLSFMKAIGFQRVTSEAAASLAAPAALLARLEGLEAHARAADARRKDDR